MLLTRKEEGQELLSAKAVRQFWLQALGKFLDAAVCGLLGLQLANFAVEIGLFPGLDGLPDWLMLRPLASAYGIGAGEGEIPLRGSPVLLMACTLAMTWVVVTAVTGSALGGLVALAELELLWIAAVGSGRLPASDSFLPLQLLLLFSLPVLIVLALRGFQLGRTLRLWEQPSLMWGTARGLFLLLVALWQLGQLADYHQLDRWVFIRTGSGGPLQVAWSVAGTLGGSAGRSLVWGDPAFVAVALWVPLVLVVFRWWLKRRAFAVWWPPLGLAAFLGALAWLLVEPGRGVRWRGGQAAGVVSEALKTPWGMWLDGAFASPWAWGVIHGLWLGLVATAVVFPLRLWRRPRYAEAEAAEAGAGLERPRGKE